MKTVLQEIASTPECQNATTNIYYDEVSVCLSRKMITSYPPELRAGGAQRKPARPCRLCPSKVDDMVDDNDDYGDDMVLVEKFIPMQLLFTPTPL